MSRELGVSDNTAWKLKHKSLQVMYERNQSETLTGRIEIDDAYLGGERRGKRGRGAAYKFPFIAAVQTDDDGHPQRLQLRRVTGFSVSELTRIAASVAAGSQVVSDGLACFQVFDKAPYHHERHVVGGGRASVEHPAFN